MTLTDESVKYVVILPGQIELTAKLFGSILITFESILLVLAIIPPQPTEDCEKEIERMDLLVLKINGK